MKLIIAGSRTFKDYELLEKEVSKIKNITEIVSGGASGADQLGIRYANQHCIVLKVFWADWKRYGLSAGPIRNQEMAEYADELLVFWDGASKGSFNMMNCMKKLGKPYTVKHF